MVTAYKSLLKEKEALEASLSSLTSNKSESSSTPLENVTNTVTDGQSKPTSGASSSNSEGADQLQMQIATLMNSLATLSAEKSKMEASFQADKRTMRSELKAKEKIVAELQEKLSGSAAQTKLEVEKVKSKLIIERHEWDKESGNQMAMVGFQTVSNSTPHSNGFLLEFIEISGP